MSKSKRELPNASLIVFGTDEDGKNRAGWFSADDLELAKTASEKLSYQLLLVETEGHLEVAAKLRPGNPTASGKAFVPVAAKSAYVDLLRLAGGDGENSNLTDGKPKTWEDIQAGHLVIAHEGKIEGWWEAIVVKRNGDSLIIRWRDYPKQPKVKRHRAQIAFALA